MNERILCLFRKVASAPRLNPQGLLRKVFSFLWSGPGGFVCVSVYGILPRGHLESIGSLREVPTVELDVADFEML